MCGITGFVSPRQRWGEGDLQKITNCLAHRGPDAQGIYFRPELGVGLGHRRLSILDLSDSANQPMYSADRRYVAVFNGEIFNYREIAKTLNLNFHTHSDTEVIIEAFAAWGPSFINKCNGFFALALYDQHKDVLWMFRDRMGIKPFYYYHKNGEFAFASELKGLVALLPGLTVNPDAVDSYLYLGYIPAPLSIYSEVRKMPQGHYGLLERGSLAFVPYWTPEKQIESRILKSEQEAKSILKTLVESAVSSRLISDVPIGTFLSGGVDSSLVTAVAQKFHGKPLSTFSIGFEHDKYDESRYAEAVAKKLGTDHHPFKVTEQDALGLIPELVSVYDEPYADASAIPTMLVSKLARAHVTVALSGDGGDELFMGYGAYTWASRLNHPLLKLLRLPIGSILKLRNDQRLTRAAGKFLYTDATRLKSHIFSQEQAQFNLEELTAIIGRVPYIGLKEDQEGLARKLTSMESQALFDLRYYLPDELLVKVDRASMRYGLEVRVPLLDYRIIGFALNLDQRLKVKGGVMKYLLKQVLYDYLPKSLFDRPKWGFAVPLGSWLRNDLRHLVERGLAEERIREANFVDSVYARQVINSFYAGNDNAVRKVWALLNLHEWYFAQQKQAVSA